MTNKVYFILFIIDLEELGVLYKVRLNGNIS